jgi:hypothetical protein
VSLEIDIRFPACALGVLCLLPHPKDSEVQLPSYIARTGGEGGRSVTQTVSCAEVKNVWSLLNGSIKVKVKFSLCLTKHHAMKTYWGSGGIAPLILKPQH